MEINLDLMSVIYAFLTLGVYTTVVCVFFYLRSEKSIDKQDSLIKEWRNEHTEQINRLETRLEKALEQNEKHWREMFTHFNTRLDNSISKA